MIIPVSSIVIAFDYSAEGVEALRAGLAFASRVRGCEPHVVTVAEDQGELVRIPVLGFTMSLVSAALMLRADVERETREGSVLDDARGLQRVVTHLRVGDVAEQVVELALSLEARGILLGRSRDGERRNAGLGAVLARKAPCPVARGAVDPAAGVELFPGWSVPSRIVA